MLITYIYIVTNGGDTKVYVRAEDAVKSLEGLEALTPAALGGQVLRVVARTNRVVLSHALRTKGHLDFAGNTGTRINRIKLNSGNMQAVLIPEGADLEEY